MTEKMNLKEFKEKYVIDSKSRGLKAIAKGVDESRIKKHKMGAIPTEVDGIKFPSILEARVYAEVMIPKLKAGLIANLIVTARGGEEKKEYVFQEEPFKYYYIPDFEYDDLETGKHEVVDAKGFEPTEYKKKRRLMKKVFGITILEIRREDLRGSKRRKR